MSSVSVLDIAPVIPVVVIDDAQDAVPLAKALLDGGVPIIEITLRTPDGLRAIELVAREVEGMHVGAGTVTRPEQAKQVHDAGARFLVSPGATTDLVGAMLDTGLPTLPGIATLSEAIAMQEAGLSELKLFPANVVGGVGMLKAIDSVLPELRFCPTGGITPETASEFLAQPNVGCVGGSWVVPREAVAGKDWARIRELAAATTTLR